MAIQIHHLSKSYEEHIVLKALDKTLEEGGIYGLMGASGSGKTTLLHILLGLTAPDSGTIIGLNGRKITAVFQENRLCEMWTAVENIAMVVDKNISEKEIVENLLEILPMDSLKQPVSELSGGMKRRVAICRAVMAASEIIVMDEPFTGLDEATRKQTIDYILKYRSNRTLIVATHQAEEAALLGAELWEL